MLVVLGEKLQEMRKSRDLTQEQLAQRLHVSRTAISKWESGRGYPSIDSLQELSKYFSVSLDDLLSNEELLTVAQEDSKQKVRRFQDLVFGLLDASVIAFLFLPLFGQRVGSVIQSVSLLSLRQTEAYIRIPYFILIISMALCGILTLALQSCTEPLWVKYKGKLSLGLTAAATLLFLMSLQPYASMFAFIFLMIKALMLIQWS